MIVEGSCARCWVLRDRAGAAEVVVAWTFWTSSAVETLGFVGEEYRPYFENYTVDASILKMRTKWDGRLRVPGTDCSRHINYPSRLRTVLGYSCDINFLRADGGCLGIWSRRRTYKSAISLGELIIEL